MKKQLNHLRRFFSRTGVRKLNAATAREVIPSSYDDDDGSNRLSGAFVVVLLLHVIALVGVFAFSRMKDSKGSPAAISASESPSRVIPAASAAAGARRQEDNPERSSSQPQREQGRSTPVETPRATPSTTASKSYVVRAGDNLTRIAFAHNLRPAELVAANGIKGDEIKPGQELVIPEAKGVKASAEVKSAPVPEKPSTPGTYTVKKNDTVAKIARNLGVRYEDLTKLNGIKDPRKLQEGQVLRVPKKS